MRRYDKRALSKGGSKTRLKPFYGLFQGLFRSAVDRDVPMQLSFDEFLKFTEEKACHYCHAKICWNPKAYFGYFLDRKENTFGYHKDNCVVCCVDCNKGKGDRFTYEEWVVMTKALRLYRDELNRSDKTNTGTSWPGR